MPKLVFEPIIPRRGHRARLAYVAVALGVAWGFVYLFAQLSREWQIAIGTVTLIAAILLLNGYHAQRASDSLDQTID